MSDLPPQTLNRPAAWSAPSLAGVMFGAALWAAVMAVSAWYGIWTLEWETQARIGRVVLLFAAGAFLAFPFGILAARFVARRRSREVSFAAAFLSLAITTIGLTALIFAFDYRTYYAEWHDDTLSVRLIFEIVFTTLSAVYQFAVLGVRLYFPIGFVGLFVASWWFARQRH